jgi:hypothetical protein
MVGTSNQSVPEMAIKNWESDGTTEEKNGQCEVGFSLHVFLE